MRASIRESETTTIARFLSGLNLEIRYRVELFPYRDLNDLIQLCIKVEQQNLRKGSSHRESSYSTSYPKREYKREESLAKEKSKETPKNIEKDVLTHKPAVEMTNALSVGRGHVQAQCPNRRTMILRGRDEYSSQEDEPSRVKEKEYSEGAYPCEGELMMI